MAWLLLDPPAAGATIQSVGMPVDVFSLGLGARIALAGANEGISGLNLHLRVDGHHLLHWGHGGDTNLDNLVLLCWRAPCDR